MTEDFAKKLVEIAIDKGADEAEAYVKTSKNLTIEIKEKKIDTLESSATAGYCVRVIKDKRLGFSYSTDTNDIESVVERAIESTKYSEPDEYLGLPENQLATIETKELKIFDDEIVSLSEDDAIKYTLLIEDAALNEDRRIKKTRKTSGSFSVNNAIIINSRGINIYYPSTSCVAQTMVIAEDGYESQMGWDFQGSRFLKEISFEEIGKTAARRALNLLGSQKIKPLKGFVILDNSVASEFLGILSSSLSSESVQKNRSMLANRKGDLVVSHRINIIDNGLIDGRLGSRPVDDEGVPTTKKILIDNGILTGYLYNTYTAKKEGLSSTGNAVRGGFTGIPSVGITNLYIEPSSKNYETDIQGLLKSVDRGLYVTETMGMHTANPISGDFSVGASGLWVENGNISQPVKEAVISGNILGMFKNIVIIGDDLRFYGNIGTPSLLIEGIDISG